MTFYRYQSGRKTLLEKPRKLKRRTWKRWVQAALIVCGGLLVLGVFAFTVFAAWVSRDLPNPNTLTTRTVPQSTKIFDRTGTHLLYEIHGDQNRTLVKIQDIPLDMQHATIAIEDKQFYQHHGIYWQGYLRSIFLALFKGQRLQGASTLTQQLAKNAFLSNARTLTRKLKEFVLALQIERTYSKDQILQMYLNEIPYGSTIYGVESAAQTYFGKSAKNLTLDEAALLASIPQAPDFYSPYGTGAHGDNRAALVGRQHYVLDQMAAQGYITKDQAAAAKAVDTLKKIQPKNLGDIKAPHFVMYVRSLLEDKYGQQQVEQGGLKVVTTLDWDKQQLAEDAVTKGVAAKGKQYSFTNAALVSLDPKTGQILAMVGSKDFFDPTIDGQVNVTLAPRQPGSSFKPIVYSAGFMQGYLPDTMLWDVNTVFKTDTGTYAPHDYDLKERGPVTIRQALQGSLNIPAVQMLYLVGVSRVLDFAEMLGYTTFSDRSRFGLSLVLGGGEVTPLEHANAYAAFATEGIHYPTSAILEVDDANGQPLETWTQPPGARVMDPQISRLMSNVLTDNGARTFVFGANNSLTLPDRPVAAKTGTTNDYHDAWTVGYTPSLVAAVWVGNSRNEPMKRGADGSIVAAPIWQAYMRGATKTMPVENFTPPDPPTTDKPVLLGKVVQQMVSVDSATGKLATSSTPPNLIIQKPTYEAHSILYYVDKDDPTGPAPTNPATDPQYANWESAVQTWVQKTQWHATDTIPLVYDDTQPQNQPQVTLIQPTANQTVGTRTLTIDVAVNAPRPIARVEASLDGTALGSVSAMPWEVSVPIPNSIGVGFHTLTVNAIDDLGDTGSASESINLTAPPQASTGGLAVTGPASGTVWSRATFPKKIYLSLDHPEIYQSIDVSFVGSDSIVRLISSEPLPTSTALTVSIPAGPPVGRYALQAVGNKKDGSTPDQAQVFVTVTD